MRRDAVQTNQTAAQLQALPLRGCAIALTFASCDICRGQSQHRFSHFRLCPFACHNAATASAGDRCDRTRRRRW